MFPIHFKLTISTPAELAAITQFVAAGYATNVANAPTRTCFASWRRLSLARKPWRIKSRQPKRLHMLVVRLKPRGRRGVCF